MESAIYVSCVIRIVFAVVACIAGMVVYADGYNGQRNLMRPCVAVYFTLSFAALLTALMDTLIVLYFK